MRTLCPLVVLWAVSACGDDVRAPADAAARTDAAATVACGEPDDIVTLPYAAEQLAGCTSFRGGVHVPDASALDTLDPLRDIERIDGRLTFFRNHALSDLRGLERLQIIGGLFAITVDDNGRFTSLDGLDSLREVGSLELAGNPALASLTGLASLEVVHGDVVIEDNPSLARSEIDALLARVRVEGEVSAADNGP
jgi:hypothetical protein